MVLRHATARWCSAGLSPVLGCRWQSQVGMVATVNLQAIFLDLFLTGWFGSVTGQWGHRCGHKTKHYRRKSTESMFRFGKSAHSRITAAIETRSCKADDNENTMMRRFVSKLFKKAFG